MRGFKLFDLGYQHWEDTQLVYHALAELGENALVIQRPVQSYVCLGMFNPASELNFEFLEEKGIPAFRREIGGGTVWLDRNQVFYHLIVNREHRLCPVKNETFFKRFLHPVIEAYSSLGIEARYRPASDLVAGGKKISGNGAGVVGDCKVLSGSVLLDFRPGTFVEALNLPQGEFKETALNLMSSRVWSLKHFGIEAGFGEVKESLIESYSSLLDRMEEGGIGSQLREEMERLKAERFTEDWLMQGREQKNLRELKVDEGCYLFHYSSGGIKIKGRRGAKRIEEIEVESGGRRLQGVEKEIQGKRLKDRKMLNIITTNFPDSREEIIKAITGG